MILRRLAEAISGQNWFTVVLEALIVVGLFIGAALAGPLQATASDEDVIALIHGEEITVKDKDRLGYLIFDRLFDEFASENGIAPSDEELEAFILRSEEWESPRPINAENYRNRLVEELKDVTLSESERQEKESVLQTVESILRYEREEKEQIKEMEEDLRTMRREMAVRIVRRWKINKALYEKYGGRVIFQQAGVAPLDAYRDFLREKEEGGAFQILDKAYEASFWRYFTNDAMHVFYDQDDGERFINTPPWIMEDTPE